MIEDEVNTRMIEQFLLRVKTIRESLGISEDESPLIEEVFQLMGEDEE